VAEDDLGKLKWLLEFAYPIIGDRKIGEIKAPELLAVCALSKSAATMKPRDGCAASAGRSSAMPSPPDAPTATFRQTCAAHDRAQSDASGGHHHPKEAGVLLRAIDAYSGYPVTHAALRIAPHVFVRPGELRHAEWTEFDLTKNVWTIPAEKTKMRVAHRVPLTRQVLAILEELREISGNRRYLLFPAQGKRDRPMCENTINLALRRMGLDSKTMTAHGFRAMASTLLNEQGHWIPTPSNDSLAMPRPMTSAAPMRVASIGKSGWP
jgi:hypothetical protein